MPIEYLTSGSLTASDISLALVAIVVVIAGIFGLYAYWKERNAGTNSCRYAITNFIHPGRLEDLVTVARIFPLRMRVDLQAALREEIKAYR